MSSSSGKEIRPFSSYGPNELTIEQACIHRDECIKQMDTLVGNATTWSHDQTMFETFRKKFKLLQQQEKLYRRFTHLIFSSKSKPQSFNQLSQPSNNNVNNNSNNSNNILPEIPTENENKSNENKNNNDNNNNHNNGTSSVINYHSEEEKCDNFDPETDRGYTNNNTSKKSKQPRLSPPKTTTNPSNPHPFIDDNNNANNSANNDNEVYSNIAYLLFTEWPHTINTDKLYQKYFNYFRVPMELTNEQIENNNQKWIVKRRNNISLNNNNNNNNENEYWELGDMVGFFNHYNGTKQYHMIRDKVRNVMNSLHPNGLLYDQLNKMFKYWIGMAPQIIQGIYDDFKSSELNEINDNNTGRKYIQLNDNKKRINFNNGWKYYSLSGKHMLICILTEKNCNNMTMENLQEKYKNYFGINLDMNSWFNQNNLQLLIDKNLYKTQKLLKINEQSLNKHNAWIQWWDENGPNNNNKAINAQINDQKCKDVEQNQNNNDTGAYDPKKTYNNGNKRPNYNNNNASNYNANNGGSYDNYNNNSQNNYNGNYNNGNSGRNHGSFGFNIGGGRHQPDQLLFIGGFPPQDHHDIKPILELIEIDYNVRFVNYHPPRLKGMGDMKYIAPIPVETHEQATRLIAQGGNKNLSLKERPDLRLSVRQYDVKERRSFGNNNNYPRFDNYNNNNNNYNDNNNNNRYNNNRYNNHSRPYKSQRDNYS